MRQDQNSALGRRLASSALLCGIIGIPLWLLSYVWILFRYAGRETEIVWSVAVACEMGAMLAVLSGTISAVMARRLLGAEGEDFRRATSGLRLSAAVFICLVIFNLTGIIFL